MTKDRPPGLPTRAQLEDRSWRALKGAVNYVWQQNLVSWCFKEAVDEARHSAPGYYAVIANPQDLGSIRARLEGGRHYTSPLQVDRDVRQMVHNAQTYNSAGHAVHKAADDLLKLWAEQWEARRVGVLWEAAQAAAAGNSALLNSLITARSRSGSVPPPGSADGAAGGPPAVPDAAAVAAAAAKRKAAIRRKRAAAAAAQASGSRHRLAGEAAAPVVMPEDDTPLTPVRILLGKHAPLSGPDLAASPLPLLRSLLRATTWLQPAFLSCGGRRAQLLGGRTSEPELLLVRCLCSECAASQLPGYMPLTHFFMHAHPALSDAPDAAAAVLTCTASGALPPGAGEEDVAAAAAASAGAAGAAAAAAAAAPGGGPSVRVADMESLKRRVWRSLRCGGSLGGAEEHPFLDLMRSRAEAAGGAALLGRRCWVYHFSEFPQKQEPQQEQGQAAADGGGGGEEGPYGTWLPASVSAYYADSGEHELRYESDPTGPSEVVQLGACFLHWGAQPPPPPPLGVPSGPAGDRPRLPLSEPQLVDFFPDRWDGPLPPPRPPLPPQAPPAAAPAPASVPAPGNAASAAASAMAAAARAAASGPEAASSYLRSMSSSGANSTAAAAAAVAAAAAAAASAAAEEPIVIDDDEDDADAETLQLQAQFAALASQVAAHGAGEPAPSAASASAAVAAAAAAAPGGSGAAPHQRLGFLRAFPPILADISRSYAVDTQIRQRVAGSLLTAAQRERLEASNCQATRTTLMSEVLKTLLERPDLDAQATARARDWKVKWATSRREPLADAATTSVIMAAVPSSCVGQDTVAAAAAGAAAATGTRSPAVPGLPSINPHPGASAATSTAAAAAAAAAAAGAGFESCWRYPPLPSAQDLQPQAQARQAQAQARAGAAAAAAAAASHPMAPGPAAAPPRVPSPAPQPAASASTASASTAGHPHPHPSPFYAPHPHPLPGMPQHTQPGSMAPGPSSAPAGAAAPAPATAAAHAYAGAPPYPPHPGYLHAPYSHPAYTQPPHPQHPYPQQPYPPPHPGSAYAYSHPHPPPPPAGQHNHPDGSGQDAQAAKRQRTDSSPAAAGNPMAPGPLPGGAAAARRRRPAAAATAASLEPTGTWTSPPAAAAVAAAEPARPALAVGGGGGSHVAGTAAATETATGATSRGPAASSGGGGAPPAAAAVPAGVDAAAWANSRFQPMTQTPKDVVEMSAAIINLVEQVPLPPADARAVRKALRQLQAADRDKFIGVTYMSLVAAAKASDEVEIQDILEELREAADKAQRQQDAPKPEAKSEAS
ncbi:hypothetical protein HXX76_013783 [Chlamydomonas incerta]|uniref:Bromo domain-containing protein n=1 Tax=Chlamydomonas incerta TaxID=51695 RepID=A0A835VTX1_CHLIN|nr:hypothetical protein HXX76_013783 [Chlamydomonas incerta]|eukprot:KAG2425369.1 hypothetical protein HXX76_013783 [Chlamydomonas incerta]